jgi:hypothetical protein
MLKYVYDFPSSSTAKFYVHSDRVYPIDGGKAVYLIKGYEWYPIPSTDTPLFVVDRTFVFPHDAPAGTPPKYFLAAP